jgi:hypothetical protein
MVQVVAVLERFAQQCFTKSSYVTVASALMLAATVLEETRNGGVKEKSFLRLLMRTL